MTFKDYKIYKLLHWFNLYLNYCVPNKDGDYDDGTYDNAVEFANKMWIKYE